jgi:hypothetical protein
MRIIVKLVVEMTPEQAKSYADTYGLAPREVREDVKSYVLNHVQCAAPFEEQGAEVSLA